MAFMFVAEKHSRTWSRFLRVIVEVDRVVAGDSPALLCSLKHGFGLPPQPAVCGRIFHQAGPHWIFQYICHPAREAVNTSKHMIERFLLPEPALSIECSIDPVSRLALDRMHDLGNREGAIFVGQWGKNHVDMIRHDYRSVQDALLVMDVGASFQSEVTSKFRQVPAKMCSEGNE
jgi:hypothetical protein